MSKKFILNADDFGLTKDHNRAVFEAYQKGLLKSASICANGEAFEEAIEIIGKCPDLGFAVHLNIMEGKSLTECPLLTDENGFFNRGYGYMILNQWNEEFLRQVEAEFDAQIKKVMDRVKSEHLDSHVHTHGIPAIFRIVCKLAKKYNIECVRTQDEKPYFVPNMILQPINFVKILLLKIFTLLNRRTVKEFGLKTNDYILGVGYTGMMTCDTVKYGLKSITNGCTEALIHPCKYEDNRKNSHTTEYELTQSLELKEWIEENGFEITSYRAF